MKINFLGTAAAEGLPGLFCDCDVCVKARELGGKNVRTRSQAIIDEELLIDFCPDTYLHVLNQKLDLTKVKNLIVTHSHSDHFYPTDLMMRGTPYAHNKKANPLHIYGNYKVKEFYERMLALENDSKDLCECIIFTQIQGFVPIVMGDYRVTPLEAQHDLNEDCFIYIIEDVKGNRILYGNDTAYFKESTWGYLNGIYFNFISLDCTMGMLEDGGTHMGLNGNIKTKDRLIEMGCADENTVFYINHFSHNGGIPHEEMEKEAGKHGFYVTYDGCTVMVEGSTKHVGGNLS